MRHWLTVLALAGASVAVLGTSFSTLDAAEPPPGESITTELHPGWNMVGWLGPEAPGVGLFEAIPALKQIYAWNSETQRHQRVLPASTPPPGLRQLGPGAGLWLFIDGESPVSWTRPVAAEGRVLPLRSGWNLVAWSGDDAGPVGDTLARYGDALGQAYRWDAAAQQYESYEPERDGTAALRGLRRGDALFMQLGADGRWWVPGTARPAYEFGDHVSVDDQEATRRLVEHARAVFAERFDLHTADFTVVVPEELPATGCVASGADRIVVPPAAAWCTAHEYFHVLQAGLAGGNSRTGGTPNWLVEGPATYAEAVWGEAANQGLTWSTQGFDERRGIAIRDSAHVRGLQHPPGRWQGDADYHLGSLATEWLVEYAGVEPLLDYYRHLPSLGWERAFAEAFGLSSEDFYTAFAAHRAAVAPPFPHVADDAVRPVVVFSGDVPADVRTAVEREMDRVYAFFGERFGVDTEYSYFLGADPDAVAETAHRLLYPGTAADLCGFSRGVWMVSTLGCGSSPFVSASTMVGTSLTGLLPWPAQNQPLFWFERGLEHYLLTSYRVAQGATAGDAVRRYAPALQLSASLPHLETDTAWYAAGDATSRALAVVAIDWLATTAGEPALLEYYHLAPRGTPARWRTHEPRAGSWQAAFEQAFGLTIDDFYEAFAAYRADVAPPLPHLVDESLEPAVVLVGEIAPEAAAPIRSRFAQLHALFSERFAVADTADRTLYVGERDSLAEIYRLLFAEEIPEGFCRRESGAVIVSTLSCYETALHLLNRQLIRAVRDRLAPWESLPEVPEGHDRRGPPWLLMALESYLDRAYKIATGAADAASARENDIWDVRRTTLTLPDLETPGDHHWRRGALSYLAGEWLARRAGEPALLDYYRQLPASAGWREAFETAFGLGVEEFYAAFAAHRAETAPPYVLHHVRGFVLDHDGHPAADTWIATSGYEARWEDITRTTADGAFDLEIRDGEYYLAVDLWISRCEVSGDDRIHNHAGIVVDGADVTGIEIRLPEGTSCAPS